MPQDRRHGRTLRRARPPGTAPATFRRSATPPTSTLDLACYNFGIQEYSPFNERVQEVFHGCPVMKDGYLYANEAPGWGIEVDEKAAAKYPFGNGERGERKHLNGGWGEIRRPRRHHHQAVARRRGPISVHSRKAQTSGSSPNPMKTGV